MQESLQAIIKARKEKLEKLRQLGIDPYPEKTPAHSKIAQILKNFSSFLRSKKLIAAAGRIVAMRTHGAIAFFDIKDSSGKIQILFKKDILGKQYEILENFDVGDFIWVAGSPFYTKTKEKTIEVRKFSILSKSLRPIPSEWFGLENIEERLRRRYLDILVNQEVKERMQKRSEIIFLMRKLLDAEGFIEVETPILQPLYGGATAKPFRTHHDLLDADFYLRIAPELYLKRLLITGFEKIYEIGKSFRNEGIDQKHNPEFTSLELYWAYQDREGLMKFLENFIKKLARSLGKKDKAIFKKWPRITFSLAIKKSLGVLYEKVSREELLLKAKERGVIFANEKISKGKIGDEIIKKIFVPKVKDPIFILDHPTEISPLSKKDPNQPQKSLRFQMIAAGWELVNGFAELNDPEDQRKRFESQERIREIGDEEAMRYDEDFIEAMEYGMPPAAGLGIGIDRLVAWLVDAPALKEVILFPMLKPKQK